VLLANIASLYAVFHGPAGLKRIASRIHRFADILATGLQQKGQKLRHAHFFDTLCLDVADKAGVLARAEAAEINLRSDILNAVGITLNETTTREDIQNLNIAWAVFFILCGLANIYIAFWLPQNIWVNFKVFGLTALTLIFTLLSGVYIYRHMPQDDKQ
jgi:hypothetical protein